MSEITNSNRHIVMLACGHAILSDNLDWISLNYMYVISSYAGLLSFDFQFGKHDIRNVPVFT